MGAPAVKHWEISARDSATLQRFYGSLFGWPMTRSTVASHYSGTPAGPGGIGGGIYTASREGEEGFVERPYHGVILFVEVDDLPAYAEKAERLGGRSLRAPFEVFDGLWMALIEDPEGNRVGLQKNIAAS